MPKKPAAGATMRRLSAIAMKQPDVTEGVACEGTVMERRTMKAANKAFLFLGSNDAMLKLDESLAEARRLAAAEPDRFRVGANGWVKIAFDDVRPPPLDVLGRWIAESYRTVTTKKRAKT